jgi:hypothetical protein
MALTSNRPFSEIVAKASTSSIGATPVAGYAIAAVAGYVQRVMAAAGGTTTGTITVAVAINGGSDIANSALTIAAGSGVRAGSVVELPLVGAGSTSGVFVNEGDIISFTPASGGGSNIPGAFALVIRPLT